MISKISTLSLLLILLAGSLMAQSKKFGYGFKAGISLAQYEGPSEIGPNGETLEKNKMSSGFHIGATFSYKFGDLMGVRGEFIYSQRGTDYAYNGPSYYVLGAGTLQQPYVTLSGTRNQTLNVGNSYIDLPFSLYYRIKGFELAGGFNFGLLISSTAGGTINFDGKSPLNKPVPFKVGLNYNYKTDKAGGASLATQEVSVDGTKYSIPTTLGAYYDFKVKDKDMFQTLDMGLVGGLSYFFNQGLFIGVRYLYGLGDVDRNEYDISLQHINPDRTLIPRSDVNKSRSWQFSIGFAF